MGEGITIHDHMRIQTETDHVTATCLILLLRQQTGNTKRPVNPVGSADAKLLPAPRLLGVARDRIGVTNVAVAFDFTHHIHKVIHPVSKKR